MLVLTNRKGTESRKKMKKKSKEKGRKINYQAASASKCCKESIFSSVVEQSVDSRCGFDPRLTLLSLRYKLALCRNILSRLLILSALLQDGLERHQGRVQGRR